jgi:NitT/TauT family transport system permease protein
MMGQPISRRLQLGLALASVTLVLLGYTWLSHRQHLLNPSDKSIPTWQQLAQGAARVVTPQKPTGQIWLLEDGKASFGRLFIGLAIGIAMAVVIGVAMGCYPVVEGFLLGPLSFLARVPPTAMLAIFFVLVGTQFKMYVTMISFGVLPILTQSVFLAVKKDVPEELIHKAYTLGASKFEAIWDVVLKQILPRIIESARLQVGPAMVYLIAAEMLVADVGFGYRLRMQSRLMEMSVVYTYLVLLGGAGYAIDRSFAWTRQWLCPWFTR